MIIVRWTEEAQGPSSAGAKRGAPAAGAGGEGGGAGAPPRKLGAREMERKAAGPPAAEAAPAPEAPKPEAPKPEAPKPEAPAPEAPAPEAPAQEAPAEKAVSPGERGQEVAPGGGEAPQSRLSGGEPPQKAEGPDCGSPVAADEDGQAAGAAAEAPPPSSAAEAGVDSVLKENVKPPSEGAPPSQGHPGEPTSEPKNEPSSPCEVPNTAAAGDELHPPAPKAPAEGAKPVE